MSFQMHDRGIHVVRPPELAPFLVKLGLDLLPPEVVRSGSVRIMVVLASRPSASG
jgi:hypothetical protein